MWIFPLIFFVCCIIRETAKILQIKTLRIIHVVGYMFAFTYGLIPAYFIYDKECYNYKHVFLEDMDYWFIWFVLGVIMYLVIQLVYYVNNHIVFIHRQHENNIFKATQISAVLALIIGAYSLMLWTRAYGGLGNAILIADLVRSQESNIFNPYAFMVHVANILIPSTLFFVYACKKKQLLLLNILCVCIAMPLSVGLLIAQDGRLSMVLFVILIVLMAMNASEHGAMSKKKLLLMGATCIAGLVTIQYINSWTAYLRTGIEYDATEYLGNESFVDVEFSHILRGGIYSVKQFWEDGSPFLIWQDIKAALFAWIPSRWKPDDIVYIWEYNTTQLMHGAASGTQPTDMVTTAIYDMGIGGPIISGIFWGGITRYIDRLLGGANGIWIIVYYFLINRFIYLVMYCELYSFVLGLFSIVLWGCIYMGVKLCLRIMPS